MRLENKVAIVTGASSGIGLAIAQKYLSEGAKVVFSDINEIDVSQHGDNAIFVKCDVSKSEEVENLIKTTIEKFGKLDVLVNNAGISAGAGILETDDASWDKVIGVNLSGVFYGIRAAAKYMKENNIAGSIINMSSILGKVGLQEAISYCASKGGVVQLTHSSALDLAPYKIRVNAVAPGFIKTNMTKDYLADENFKKMVESNTPLGFVGDPEDIANGALYLASDESRYVTGEVLYIDGGWTAR